jgi:hypothetical protein
VAVGAPDDREHLTIVTSVRSSLLEGLGLGLVLGLIVWLSFDSGLRWLLAAGVVLLGLCSAPLWSPTESLWLDGSVLVQKRRGKLSQVDLSRLVSVKREWIPKKGDDLVLTDASGGRVVVWTLNDTTEDLRRAVGQRARVVNASTDLFDPKTKRLLLL